MRSGPRKNCCPKKGFTRVAPVSLGDLPAGEFGWGGYLSADAHLAFAHHICEDATSVKAMGRSVDHVGLAHCPSKDGDRIDLTGGQPPVP